MPLFAGLSGLVCSANLAVESDITKLKEQEIIIKKEKEKSDSLLLNILPNETARELKEKGRATPRLYRKTSVLFTDFKDKRSPPI